MNAPSTILDRLRVSELDGPGAPQAHVSVGLRGMPQAEHPSLPPEARGWTALSCQPVIAESANHESLGGEVWERDVDVLTGFDVRLANVPPELASWVSERDYEQPGRCFMLEGWTAPNADTKVSKIILYRLDRMIMVLERNGIGQLATNLGWRARPNELGQLQLAQAVSEPPPEETIGAAGTGR